MFRSFFLPFAALGACLILPSCSRTPSEAQATGNILPKLKISSSPDILKAGKEVYDRNCAPCHGLEGDAQGPAAYLLYPKPRDFVRALYRLVSTWDYMPTDADIFATISRGMPGSAMPSWAHLTEESRWALVHYVKSFSTNPFDIQKDHQPQNATDPPKGHVQVPPEIPYAAANEANAKALYVKNCESCHGVTGKGDGQKQQEDSEGYPTRPRDLTVGIYKGIPDAKEVYKRIVAGLPGSPMPSHPHLYGKDAWDLVHFVRAMSSDQQRARMEMKRFRIAAVRVERLPEHPDDSVWRQAKAVELHLMPLWWRDDRPETLSVQAVHDGTQIAFQLIWADRTHDATAIRPQDFRDSAAIELSGDADDPPFFGMGESAHAGLVNIWMWKAERQADMEPAFQDIEKVYPNIGIDSYPNTSRSALEQPARHALTLQSDPKFVTGWGAGNIVSDPTRKSAAEDLAAGGFGTLHARRPPVDQSVSAAGVHATGSYRVVLRRAMKPGGKESVDMKAGAQYPVAFAVWDGSAADRDGKKSITIWQQLEIQK
jgi:mono/diheme cytochrome c family protein